MINDLDIEKIKLCLKDNFPTEFSYKNESSIVFPDGLIISAIKHPKMVQVLDDNHIKNNNAYYSGSTFFARDLNCLRMTICGFGGKENYVALPKNKLTYEQEEKLLDWLYLDMPKAKHFSDGKIDIVFDFFNNFLSKQSIMYNYNDYTPEEILKDIKKRYNQNENL